MYGYHDGYAYTTGTNTVHACLDSYLVYNYISSKRFRQVLVTLADCLVGQAHALARITSTPARQALRVVTPLPRSRHYRVTRPNGSQMAIARTVPAESCHYAFPHSQPPPPHHPRSMASHQQIVTHVPRSAMLPSTYCHHPMIPAPSQ